MHGVRWTTVLLMAWMLAGCTADRETVEEDAPDVPEEVESEALSDWAVRLDEQGQNESGFQMVEADEGFRVTTGPAGIAWRAVDLIEQGNFTAAASFTEVDSPQGHREGYGVLVGGKNLDSPDQEYTYFLIRGTGHYMVKRREGTATSELTGWNPSPEIRTAQSGSDATNRLSVQVRGDSVDFAVNGTTVQTLPTDAVQPWGVAGVRVNHRLDLQVSEWEAAGG